MSWSNGKAKVDKDIFIKLCIAHDFNSKKITDEINKKLKVEYSELSTKRRIATYKKKNWIKTSQKKEKDKNETVQDGVEIYKLKEKIKELSNELKDTKRRVTASDEVKSLIFGVQKENFRTTPEKVIIKDTSDNHLVPCLQLTDIHIGEVVDSRETGGEDYNTSLAKEWTHQVVDDFINICINNMSNYKYKRFVLILGGDLITNDLHDLGETNDISPTKQIIVMVELISQVINKLRNYFEEVDVFAVSGNHGRLDSKNRTKTKKRTEFSLEHLGYYFLQKEFEDCSDVKIFTDESDELTFTINTHTFNLQHGDRFKGGNGIGGIHVPVNRARAKLLQTAHALDAGFNTLIIGHFHQHYVGEGLIIGNSIKPYDEYCRSMNIPYSEAGATSWFVNKHGDICFSTNLKIRRDKHKRKSILCLD